MKKARKQEYAPVKDLIMQNKFYKYLYEIVSMYKFQWGFFVSFEVRLICENLGIRHGTKLYRCVKKYFFFSRKYYRTKIKGSDTRPKSKNWLLNKGRTVSPKISTSSKKMCFFPPHSLSLLITAPPGFTVTIAPKHVSSSTVVFVLTWLLLIT